MGQGQSADGYVRTHGRKVADVMTPTPITIADDRRLDDIVSLMERRAVMRLPVARQGCVAGIVSRASLLPALASVVGALPAAATTDVTIREQIMSELSSKAWSPRDFNVVVRDGVVELWGEILDEREAGKTVAGVKAVKITSFGASRCRYGEGIRHEWYRLTAVFPPRRTCRRPWPKAS
jgi:hypothetical protein